MDETRDPRPKTLKMGSETREPGPNLQVEPGTRDTGHLFYMRPKTQDPRHGKRDLGHL